MISRRFGRNAGWGIADQSASSLTNFALGVLVARDATADEFGAFSMAFVTYLLFLNVGRAIVAYPLLIRYSNVAPERWRTGAGMATATAVILGLAVAAVAIPFGMAVGGELGTAMAGMGLVMPALLLQDAWRFVFVSAGRSRDAFFNDAIRVVLLVPTVGALVALDLHTVLGPVIAWGIGAAVAAVAGSLQAGVLPAWPRIRTWLTEHRDLIPRFVAESLTTVGSLQLTYVVIGAIGGLAVVGAIRGAELLLGPYNVFSLGVMLVALPEATRMLKISTGDLVRLCVIVSSALGSVAILVGSVLFFLPDQIGTALLGASWDAARSVVITLALAMAATMATSGASTGLRAMEAAGRVLRAAVVTSIGILVSATVGVSIGGVNGAVWGLVLGSTIGLVFTWWELLDEVARRRSGGVP
jgi:O-antigen/teichoic acid export membrane protein